MAQRQFIFIDGPSGAGKTTYAAQKAAETGFEVVHLDDFYPGWGGLVEASRMVARDVLHPTKPGFTRWDWEADRPAEWVALDPDASLIIEGVGAITKDNLEAAGTQGQVYTVRITAREADRRRRALARDPGYAPFWEMWAAQEREFFAGPGAVDVDEEITW